ncbi:CASP-like protein 1D1 [Phragmites australis]|uniref:CASP-like protein 1D1 n=1 Tax=Phragmites australis TaxID=29695 RepID=UPI002D778D05|nr:CASP-like protein 1D1 [Phragmites australis]
MATVDTTTESGKAAPESGGYPAARAPSPPANFSCADLVLRAFLFAATLSALVVLVTAKQTVLVPVALAPRLVVMPITSKFKDSPALIYLLVALCVTCFYSLLTAVSSLRFISGSASTAKTLFLVLLLDVFYAAIMASATGSAGGVAWIGLNGNSHTRWIKICNVYGKFCRHIGSSTFLSLIASIVLVLLAVLDAYSLYRRSR